MKLKKYEIVFIICFGISFVLMLWCDFRIKNDGLVTDNRYTVDSGIVFNNPSAIDDEGNLYVTNKLAGVVQKFDKKGKFKKSFCFGDVILNVRNEKDGIHIYTGKSQTAYHDYKIEGYKIKDKIINQNKIDKMENEDKNWEKVIYNIWISNQGIVLLQTGIFPIDPTIFFWILVIMKLIQYLKSQRNI